MFVVNHQVCCPAFLAEVSPAFHQHFSISRSNIEVKVLGRLLSKNDSMLQSGRLFLGSEIICVFFHLLQPSPKQERQHAQQRGTAENSSSPAVDAFRPPRSLTSHTGPNILRTRVSSHPLRQEGLQHLLQAGGAVAPGLRFCPSTM